MVPIDLAALARRAGVDWLRQVVQTHRGDVLFAGGPQYRFGAGGSLGDDAGEVGGCVPGGIDDLVLPCGGTTGENFGDEFAAMAYRGAVVRAPVRYLALLGTADGQALALRGGFYHGPWVWGIGNAGLTNGLRRDSRRMADRRTASEQ